MFPVCRVLVLGRCGCSHGKVRQRSSPISDGSSWNCLWELRHQGVCLLCFSSSPEVFILISSDANTAHVPFLQLIRTFFFVFNRVVLYLTLTVWAYILALADKYREGCGERGSQRCDMPYSEETGCRHTGHGKPRLWLRDEVPYYIYIIPYLPCKTFR